MNVLQILALSVALVAAGDLTHLTPSTGFNGYHYNAPDVGLTAPAVDIQVSGNKHRG